MSSSYYAINRGNDAHPHFDLRARAKMVGPFATRREASAAAGAYSIRQRVWTVVVSSAPDDPTPRAKPRGKRAAPPAAGEEAAA